MSVATVSLLPAQYSIINSAGPVALPDLHDNPAAWAFSYDVFAAGIETELDANALDSYQEKLLKAPVSLAIPFFLYRYKPEGFDGGPQHSISLSSMLTPSSALAYTLRTGNEGFSDSLFDINYIFRPNGLFSTAFSVSDVLNSDRIMNIGLGVRPLAFADERYSSLIQLFADAVYKNDSFSFASVGLNCSLGNVFSLASWYDVAENQIGLGLYLSLNSNEVSLKTASFTDYSSIAASYGIRIQPKLPAPSVLPESGRKLLLVSGKEMLLDAPPPSILFNTEKPVWHDLLVETIGNAAKDDSIEALVFVDPHAPSSDARGQELFRALIQFRESGKPIYCYADNLDRSSYVYLAAISDMLAINPNAELNLVDIASFSFYYKGLFEKLGISFYNLQSHDTKTANNPYTEYGMTEAERRMKERYVSSLSAQLHAMLADARADKLSEPSDQLFAKGPYLLSSRALDTGLVDSLMYKEEFEDYIEEQHPGAKKTGIFAYNDRSYLSWGPEPFNKKVHILHLNGSILMDTGISGVSIGSTTANRLRELREDSSVDAIILRIDSGGGSAYMSDLISREVALCVESGKPVYVSMSGFAASGGYYIAAKANRIFAEEATITGSIGVTGMLYNVSSLMEKLGVTADLVGVSTSADFDNAFLPESEEDKTNYQRYIREVYDRFVTIVAEGRDLEKSRVDEIGKGQVWLGSEALDLGLIDELGGLQETKAALQRELNAPLVFIDEVPGERAPFNIFNYLIDMRVKTELPFGLDSFIQAINELEAMGAGALYLLPEYISWHF